ncbi:MAG: hypothetical protein II970_06130 [Paludibacteraceae bacterium]|nr:hypothetical protein [Paludibacteraceae bacterium]
MDFFNFLFLKFGQFKKNSTFAAILSSLLRRKLDFYQVLRYLALDKTYRLGDTLDLQGLFANLDYADKVAEFYPAVANGVLDAKRILQDAEPLIIAPTALC